MKKLLYLILFFSPVSIISQYVDEPNCTSIYLIRHAEKDRTNKEERNPHLNDKGIERTFKWKSFFKNIKFDKFYSTNYHRTIETIQPISNGEDIVIYIDSIVLQTIGKSKKYHFYSCSTFNAIWKPFNKIWNSRISG